MTPNIDNIIRDLPAGLTEADLIDMIDGAVSPARKGVVIDAVRANPRLGLLVKQMRVDRAAMQAAGPAMIAAPANMMEAIDAKLDRAALSELVHEAEEASAPIPISQFMPEHRGGGVIAVLAESVWARRLATAASLAIVGGLGVLGARELMQQWPRISGKSPIAAATPGTPDDSGTDAPDPTERRLAADIHSPATDTTDPLITIAAGNDKPAPAGAAPDTPVAELSAADAVKLAQAGRLVITVRSRQLTGTLKHLESLSRAAGPDVRWRSHQANKLPIELASLATPLPEPAFDAHPSSWPHPANAQPTLAASDHSDATPSTTVDQPQPPSLLGPAPRVVVKEVRVVRMNADAQRLGDLLRDLTVSKVQTAEFRILPVGSALDQRPGLDADSVLWWSAGPESWTPRIAVPVVVEAVE